MAAMLGNILSLLVTGHVFYGMECATYVRNSSSTSVAYRN